MKWFSRHPRIEDLVADHYEAVYRFAYRLCGTQTEAEDVTQEAFCQAQTKLSQLRDPAAARGWIFSIARNTFLHRVRSKKLEKAVPLEDAAEPMDRWDAEPLSVDPAVLQDALGNLPEAYRTPLILYFFEEFSYRDIAEQLGIPMGTVMSRLARGKECLKNRLLRTEPALAESRKGTA